MRVRRLSLIVLQVLSSAGLLAQGRATCLSFAPVSSLSSSTSQYSMTSGSRCVG